jgi:hypothetical protein
MTLPRQEEGNKTTPILLFRIYFAIAPVLGDLGKRFLPAPQREKNSERKRNGG